MTAMEECPVRLAQGWVGLDWEIHADRKCKFISSKGISSTTSQVFPSFHMLSFVKALSWLKVYLNLTSS